MGRVKEAFFYPEDDAEEVQWKAKANAEFEKRRGEEAQRQLNQERDWASKHPGEWAEWLRVSVLLFPVFDFCRSKWFDFPEFLQEVGKRPSSEHSIARKNKSAEYMPGNLVWRKRKRKKGSYLNYQEVESEFGIKKSALYRLRDQNLIEWSKPPGASYLFSRSSLKRFMKENGRVPRAHNAMPASAPKGKRARQTGKPSGGFRFLK